MRVVHTTLVIVIRNLPSKQLFNLAHLCSNLHHFNVYLPVSVLCIQSQLHLAESDRTTTWTTDCRTKIIAMKGHKMKARRKRLIYHRLRAQTVIMDQRHCKTGQFLDSMFHGVEWFSTLWPSSVSSLHYLYA